MSTVPAAAEAQRSVGLDADFTSRRGEFSLHAQFSLQPGERMALLGPNGAGKSTILAALAGLLPPARGEGKPGLSGSLTLSHPEGRVQRLLAPGHRPPQVQERKVTLLEQRALLFPHMSAVENIAFGLRSRGVGKDEALGTARQWLERVEFGGRESAKPHELSGGQQQRVAIARALAANPHVLLLDEPFAALDADTTPRVRSILVRELHRQQTTTILVTHHLEDALQMAHTCCVVDSGRIVERSTPAQIATEPQTRFSAALAGIGVIAGTADHGDFEPGGGASALGFAHPDEVELCTQAVPGGIDDTVSSVRSHGGRIAVVGRRGLIALTEGHVPAVGERVWFRPVRMRVVRQ